LENEGPKSASFASFPLSSATVRGLRDSGYTETTEVQRETLRYSLRGLDVLGAAKTGSGKTLAFVIPLLERLFVKRWSREDGLGALVITPTRELAYQIFDVLNNVGRFHEFSAGLVIGGKDLAFERDRMATCNIVVCTPGRLLQHMDENPQFDASQLQLLVLDEADRCLEMGFAAQMNAILANLPSEARQTLLFSATQTRSVKDLARCGLSKPVLISVHEHASKATPDELVEHYMVCPLDQKIDILWSFIKNHRKKKVLVFLQSCKQVSHPKYSRH
jgi:ATP-dependent RNA helicase DDX10/DBP4